jgi:hypothetical protein
MTHVNDHPSTRQIATRLRAIPTGRLVSGLVAGSLALSLAACGDDSGSGSPVDSVPTDPTAPPATTPPDSAPPTTSSGIEHPVGADDVVLRIGYEGGFVPIEHAFLNLPTLLVTGDGRLIVQGPQIEIYPGPLLPNMQVRTISEEGIQQLLDMAAEHGLLTDREYTNPTNIADAPDTVVVINANGDTYEHRAYALAEGDADELRQALAAFVSEATGPWLYEENPELGPEASFEADTYLVRAFPDPELDGYEIEPTIVEWPADAPPLADATECLAVPAAQVAEVLTAANQLTFFTSGGATYQVAAKPQLPGDGC